MLAFGDLRLEIESGRHNLKAAVYPEPDEGQAKADYLGNGVTR
jgi:hypothetical protein